MKDFHHFVKTLFLLWLCAYGVLMLPGLCHGMAMYVLSDFMMPARHYLDIMHTVYQGALWMVPTVFLAAAYYFSRPHRDRRPELTSARSSMIRG